MKTIEEEGRTYIEVDTIRLVVEDGDIVGWYAPAGQYGHWQVNTYYNKTFKRDVVQEEEVYAAWCRCSECGEESFIYDFCPNCGARMMSAEGWPERK